MRRADAGVLLVRAAAIAPAVMTPDDVATLAGWRSRRRAGRLIRERHGPAAAAAARRLRRAQVRLAAALARPYRGWVAAAPPYWYAPPVLRWWQEGYEARQQLAAAGGPAVDRLPAAGSTIGGGRAADPVAAGAMAAVSASAGSAGSRAAATAGSAGSAGSAASGGGGRIRRVCRVRSHRRPVRRVHRCRAWRRWCAGGRLGGRCPARGRAAASAVDRGGATGRGSGGAGVLAAGQRSPLRARCS